MFILLAAASSLEPLALGQVRFSDLLSDEQEIVTTLASAAWSSICGPSAEDCRDRQIGKSIAAINGLRAVRRAVGSGYYAREVEAACKRDALNQITDGREAWNACFLSYDLPTDALVIKRLGVRSLGVTPAGYSAIRIGMTAREVEITLGAAGRQRAYSSVGGYSHEVRQWLGRRGGVIIVTLTNWEVSGKSQAGLD